MRIVDFKLESGSYVPLLKSAPLEKIFKKHDDARDKPLMPIDIGGIARSGKSFLLNLIVSYLTYVEQVCRFYTPTMRCEITTALQTLI